MKQIVNLFDFSHLLDFQIIFQLQKTLQLWLQMTTRLRKEQHTATLLLHKTLILDPKKVGLH